MILSNQPYYMKDKKEKEKEKEIKYEYRLIN